MSLLWIPPQDRVLTTAEILYYFPDYPALLQQYIWQDYDAVPDFPTLKKFIQYWNVNLDGKVHSVRIARGGMFVDQNAIRIPLIETSH